MRNKVVKIGLAVVGAVGFSVLLGVAFLWLSGGSAQASGVLNAPALKPGATGKLFQIIPEQSEVRFIIDEVLIGQPKSVVGKTNQVAGNLIVDFQNPAQSQLGVIKINVRALETDNEFRNKALRGQILQSVQPEFEFATFVPTVLNGLPKILTPGQTVAFQIVGKLTLRKVTRDVTFDATLTLVSSAKVTGSAKATVSYKNFELAIPEAPGVANVAENVRLEIDFTASLLPTP